MRRAVDWREVEQELDDLPEEFKEQGRFDSLPHVIEILRTLDPSQALGDLRERHERIESLVDDIVKGYHGGFNKSIHSYSEILRLFTEAQAQNKSIRSSLLALKKQLGSRTTQLRNHWHRSNVLRHTLTILDNVERIAHVPDKVDVLCGLPAPLGPDGFGFGAGGHGGHGDGSDDETAVDFSSGAKGSKGAGHHRHRSGSQGKGQAASGSGSSSGSHGGGSLHGQQGAALLSGLSLEDRLQRYEECTDLLRFALGELTGENSESFNQVKVLCEMKESVVKREKMVKSRILEEISGYLYKRSEDSGEAEAFGGLGGMGPARPRTLSIQSPEQKERQEVASIERLARCMIGLGDAAFTATVLKDCQQRLQRCLVDFWKDTGAGHFGERGKGLASGPAAESKVLSYVSERAFAMCGLLQRVYDRLSELVKAVAVNGTPANKAEQKQGEDGAFMGEAWTVMQAECIALLRILMNVQLPTSVVMQRKLSEALTPRARNRSSVSSGAEMLKFTFANEVDSRKSPSSSKGQESSASRRNSAGSAGAKPIIGYRQALGKCMNEDLFGLYLVRAVYEPMQNLSRHVDAARIPKFPSFADPPKPVPNTLMQFLAEQKAKLTAQERSAHK